MDTLNPALNKCFSRVLSIVIVSEGRRKGFFAYESTHELSIWPVGTALGVEFLGLRDLSCPLTVSSTCMCCRELEAAATAAQQQQALLQDQRDRSACEAAALRESSGGLSSRVAQLGQLLAASQASCQTLEADLRAAQLLAARSAEQAAARAGTIGDLRASLKALEEKVCACRLVGHRV